jgi:hypothetical protein
MARMTITLPDALHAALKESAARSRRAMGDLIAESLVAYGVKSRESAEEIVARARARAGRSEAAAMKLAIRETRAARRSR